MVHPGRKKGFTLIETLVVVVIVALMVSIAVPAVGNTVTRKAAETNALNLRTVEGKLRTLRMTKSETFEKWLGETAESEENLLTVVARNGAFILMNNTSVSAPTSVRMSSGIYTVESGTQMSVCLGEDELYCHYDGIPAEVFEAIAKDKTP